MPQMNNEVSVRLTERVWRELIGYEPLAQDAELSPAIRTQLQAGVALTEERPARLDFRMVTVSVDEAYALERWLTAASRRHYAPMGCGVALVAVREGLRLAAA